MSDSKRDIAAGMDLHFLLSELDELKTKYMELGLFLKVSKDKIDGFEKDYPNNSYRVFIEVLNYWLKNHDGDKEACLCKAVCQLGSSNLRSKILKTYSEKGIDQTEQNSNDVKTAPSFKKDKDQTQQSLDDAKRTPLSDKEKELHETINNGSRLSLQNLMVIHGQNIHERITKFDETLLHLACKNGQLDIVRTLIEVYGCRFDINDKFGNSPCHLACENGQTEIMAYFFRCPYQLSCTLTNSCCETWLHGACKAGSLQLIRLITYEFIDNDIGDSKLVDFNDNILLHMFSKNKLVKLNNDFSDVFIPDDNGNTPLHVACKKNNLEVIRLFLCELNILLNFNFMQYIPSVLQYACELRHFDIIKYLSQYHYKPLLPCPIPTDYVTSMEIGNGDRTYPKEIALFFAARRGDYELFQYLSQSVKTFDIKNAFGDTLLHAACVSNDARMISFCSQEFILDQLDITAKNELGSTCLHVACEWGSEKFVDFLIERNVSIDEPNINGDTPLHLAIRNKRSGIFDVLLNKNANLNASNTCSETPLHVATCNPEGMYYVKKLLSNANCSSINKEDKYGDTPLFNACRTKNKTMVLHLLRNEECDCLFVNPYTKETVANIACRFAWLDILEEILSVCTAYPKKLQNYLGQTLVHIACWNDDFELLKFLAKKNLSYDISEDINLMDFIDQLTPLQFACKQNDSGLLKYLLNLKGCSADTKNKDGNTVLHICSLHNLKEMAKLCLPKCSKTIRNEEGNTPLHLACFEKNFDLLHYFILSLPDDLRLDTYINKQGKNILHVVASQEGTLDILKHLVASKNFSNNYKDKRGNTALHFAFQSGVIKNAKYLISAVYVEELWYNKDGKSPLSLAVENGKLDFIESIVEHCSKKMLFSCYEIRNPDHKFFSHGTQVVELPLILYLLYLISEIKKKASHNYKRKSIAALICEIVTDPNFQLDIAEIRDSYDNTILHYISVCKHSKSLKKLLDIVFSSTGMNTLNKGQSAPLHYACSSHQDWMIYELFERDESHTLETLNIRSIVGTPFSIYRNRYCDDVLYYLVAYGAINELNYLTVSHEAEERSYISIGIIVLGNSTNGKTTLIDTLRMMITNNRDPDSEIESTTGIVTSEFHYYKNGHRYVFYDFAGQVEFETSHSIHLENLLSHSTSTKKNSFAFLLLVKGTDTLDENKKQIDRWISFVRGHVKINSTNVHVILVCSHDDLFENAEAKEHRRKELAHYMDSCDSTPLDKHEYPIFLNGTKTDTSSVNQLMGFLEDMFISCEPYDSCQISNELNYYIQQWFPDNPCQVRELIAKIKEIRTFKLDDNHEISCCQQIYSPKILFPHELTSLITYLDVLFCRNDILLLKQPENELDWWILGKKVQNKLFSKANSLFSPPCFSDHPDHSLDTFNTGIVPISKLEELYDSLDLDIDLITLYLISLEFCKEISDDTAEIIGFPPESNKESEKIFFFPGLIRKERGDDIFQPTKERNIYTSGLLIQNKENWGLRFLHSLLLRLTYTFAMVKDNQHYARRIRLWKNGLYLNTRKKVEVLVELKDDRNVYVICRSSSNISLAKLRHEILEEIHNIQDYMKEHFASEFSSINEYILYPPPKFYDSIEASKQIPLMKLKQHISEDDSQIYPISDIETVEFEELFCFEPYIYLEPSVMKKSKGNMISIKELHENILHIPEMEIKVKDIQEIQFSEVLSILQKYSVFSVDQIVN